MRRPWPALGRSATGKTKSRWEWMVKATPRSLHPLERDPVLLVREAEWASGPVWTVAQPFLLLIAVQFCTIIYLVLILRYDIPVMFKLCRMEINTLYIYIVETDTLYIYYSGDKYTIYSGDKYTIYIYI